MKNKKVIAISLCIGVLASSLSSSYISSAKNYKNEFMIKKNDASSDNSLLKVLPTQNIIELEPEVYSQENMTIEKIITTSEEGEDILFEGTRSTLNPEAEDMFHIGENEIEDLMNKGYSVEDIFEADKLSNEIGIEPETLLEKKELSNKSFEQIKKDILAESKEKVTSDLKSKYKNEYKKLKDKNLKESEIINLLTYIDVNDVKLTDGLINEYKKNKDKVLKIDKNNMKNKEVSRDVKKKYQLSDTDVENLSEDIMDKLEGLSKKTGIPVKELTEAYNKNNNNKKK